MTIYALSEFRKLSKKLPKFPDGRLNYKNSKKAVVLTVFVKFKGKILLLKRSNRVLTYKGYWNTVAGYYDEPKPLRKKALEELKEETGISKKYVKSIKFGKMFRFHDKKINKIWLVNPILIKLKKKPKIKIDFEHTKAIWIKPEEIKNYKIVPNLKLDLRKLFI
ncbi:MAG TPA: NUDIX domain-containing protein [Candidatus Nanoarchaeia archaeon]|nr:NUDIX domain-containing protein [Candidatus Nanoarchaeia archaeon]